MQDEPEREIPAALDAIVADTARLGFDMASEPRTGALLRLLAASRPGGRLLELGTGTGISAAWILSGMDSRATLVTIDDDSRVQRVADEHLGGDPRLEIVCADAADWLERNRQARFDLVFADAWPGKFSHLELALGLLAEGGIYVIDDLLPQPSWPEGHAPRVPALLREIEAMPGFTTLRMAWASGLMLVVRQGRR
jgi:predicted O-methyltransferase YrrM